eukprot:248476-Pyramimonas_sp.AAC.1
MHRRCGSTRGPSVSAPTSPMHSRRCIADASAMRRRCVADASVIRRGSPTPSTRQNPPTGRGHDGAQEQACCRRVLPAAPGGLVETPDRDGQRAPRIQRGCVFEGLA